jgi:hypothetical protein
MQSRSDRQPEVRRVRRQTVEHPCGTIKHMTGWMHFLTKTLWAATLRKSGYAA